MARWLPASIGMTAEVRTVTCGAGGGRIGRIGPISQEGRLEKKGRGKGTFYSASVINTSAFFFLSEPYFTARPRLVVRFTCYGGWSQKTIPRLPHRTTDDPPFFL